MDGVADTYRERRRTAGDARLERGFGIEFENSDRFNVSYNNKYEFLPEPFGIASGITLPVGGYDFSTGRMSYNFGRQRPVAANVSVEHGTFYSGHKTTVGVSRSRLIIFSPRFSVEPRYSVNWVDLVEGAFTTHLVGFTRHLHNVAQDVRERAPAVQLGERLYLDQRPAAVGIPAGQ